MGHPPFAGKRKTPDIRIPNEPFLKLFQKTKSRKRLQSKGILLSLAFQKSAKKEER